MNRLLILAFITAAVFGLSVFLRVDAGGLGLLDPTVDEFLIREIRLPRALLAAMIGASLASCGLLFQSTLRNPLASEFTLGASAGASLGVMLAVLMGLGTGFLMLGGFAFAGAAAISLPAYLLALRRRVPPEAVLLAGVALSFAAMAVTSGANFVASSGSMMTFVRWSLGDIAVLGFDKIGMAGLPCLLPVATAWAMRHRLDAMSGGEELALARGVEVSRLRGITVLVVTVAVGASVAVCGPIGFIGLVVPHMARGLVGYSHGRLTIATPLLGAGLVLVCDLIGRNLIRGMEIPLGTTAAAIGTPVFLWMLVKRFGQRRE